MSSLLCLIEPSDALALVPLTILDFSLARVIGTEAVLFSISPAAIVLSTIGPGKHAVSFLLVIDVLTVVLSAVRPSENSCAIHLIILPLAIVLATV